MKCESGTTSQCIIRFLRHSERGLIACWLVGTASALFGSLGRAGQDYLGYIYGSFLIPSLYGYGVDPFSLLAWIAPLGAFIYWFSGTISSSLEQDGAVLLLRVRSRNVWTAAALISLFLDALVFALLEAASVFVVGAIFGAAPVTELFVVRLVLRVFLEALIGSFLVLVANLVALWVDQVFAFGSVLGVHVCTLIGLSAAPEALARRIAKFLPSARGVLAWNLELGGDCTRIGHSVLLLALFSVIAAALLFRAVRHRDIYC